MRDTGNPHSISDDELVVRWCHGDRDAGQALVTRHFACVYRFFVGKVGEAAADLTQRTFLACVEGRTRFDRSRSSTFRSYLLGIAHNHLLRHFHEARRRGGARWAMGPLEEPPTSPTGNLARHEENTAVERALRTVPLDFRMTLELHYLQGLKVHEIAEVLAISEGTVKSRLYRGRRVLRRALAAEPATGGSISDERVES